jgi:hypothetical protein
LDDGDARVYDKDLFTSRKDVLSHRPTGNSNDRGVEDAQSMYDDMNRNKAKRFKADKEFVNASSEYSSERERASRNGSTVVDISIPPLSFRPVSLILPRSPLSKTPKQVFFNPINIFDIFYHTLLLFF